MFIFFKIIIEIIRVLYDDFLNVSPHNFGDPNSWIQTSFNTYGGQHSLGGTPLRKNYAGVGMIYDKDRDAFYSPQPYPSWTLDENHDWQPPVAHPGNGLNDWNEGTLSWDKLPDVTE